MRSTALSPDVIADFSGFGELRRRARSDDPQALQAVARQFEALLLHQMLEGMRATTGGDPLLGGAGADLYRGLLDQQLSIELSRQGGIGLAELLARQIGASLPGHSTASPSPVSVPPPGPPPGRRGGAGEPIPAAPPSVARPTARVPGSAPPGGPAAVAGGGPRRFESPAQFVEVLAPHARRAGEALGIAPEVLLAQAALETGWGRHVIGTEGGASSHNLFGIKASRSWDGSRAHVSTLEFEDGVMVRRIAPFRVYESWGASFDDYVDLVRGSPRYADALARAPDPAGYMGGLAAAGYATDPDYARKVLAVLRSEHLAPLAAARSPAGIGAASL